MNHQHYIQLVQINNNLYKIGEIGSLSTTILH